MELTGEILKKGRDAKGLSISEVALATKISPRVLEAIESGDVDNLPPKSYLRGFVRSYAMYLKVDTEHVLHTFQEEMGSTTHQPVTDDEAESPPQENKTRSILAEKGITSKTLAATAIIVLIFVIIGIKKLIEKYEAETVLPQSHEVVSLKKDSDASQISTVPTPEEANKVDEAIETKSTVDALAAGATSATEAISAEPESKPSETKPVEEIVKVAPVEAEPVKVKAEAKPEAKKEPVVETKEKPAAVAQAPAQAPQEIIVEALDQVKVSFAIDGGKQQNITLEPEEIHIFKASKTVTLEFSDGGAVNLVHNGSDKGVPGDLGKSKQVNFP